MNSINYPILEFDNDKNAIINPTSIINILDVPERCIYPFYHKVIEDLKKKGYLEEIIQIESSVTHNIILYEFEYEGTPLALISPGLGAPFAAGNLELAIALGCRKFLAIGSCGILNSEIEHNQFIIPTSAIRDEGTSYHYLPPSREVESNPRITQEILKYLNEKDIKYLKGKTWTTDGFFRETPGKIRNRKSEGAIVVEMEAAALFSVAKFRNVELGYILTAGDDVSGVEWDRRLGSRSLDFYEKFFWIAAEICTRL